MMADVKQRWTKRICHNVNGYMTVEAALVMPVVLGVIVFTMFLMFFRYDRCYMEQNIARALVEVGTMPCEDKGRMVNQLKVDAECYGKDGFLFWTAMPVSAKMGNGKVCIEGEGSISFPFGHLIGISMTESAGCEFTADLLDEPMVLRMVKKWKEKSDDDKDNDIDGGTE